MDIDPNAQFNGTFSFQGTETGSDFADFLLGVPSGYIQAAGTGDKVAFTVFEPGTLEGGKSYPLVLQASGFGLTRDTASSNANVKPLVEAGYGVISFDHRGHGESGGVVRGMDPDYEGKDLLALLDWAEARLDWLQYRPSAGDPHNLVLGSMG